MKRFLLFLAALLCAGSASASVITVGPNIQFAGAPSGACFSWLFAENAATGAQYNCLLGSWNLIAAGGGSPVSGSGTINTIPKFTAATVIGNSSITDDGTNVATLEQVGIGVAVPTHPLDVQAAGNAFPFAVNISTSSVGTGLILEQIVNTGGITYLGNDSSTGGNFAGGNYASFFGSAGATPSCLMSASVCRILASSAGVINIPNLSASQLVQTDGSKNLVSSNTLPAGTTLSPLASIDLTGQTAAKTATALYTPAATAMIEVCYYAKVTTVASISSILGGTSGLVVTYTDGTDLVAQTAFTLPEDNQAGTALSVGTGNVTNTTQAVIHGCATIFAKTGVAMTYAFGYQSTNATEMAYELHIRVNNVGL